MIEPKQMIDVSSAERQEMERHFRTAVRDLKMIHQRLLTAGVHQMYLTEMKEAIDNVQAVRDSVNRPTLGELNMLASGKP